MIRGIYYSARGMSIESIKQDVISNNLANVNTNGFKKDTVLIQSFDKYLNRVQQGENAADMGPLGSSPLINSIVTRFDQGMIEQTGRNRDFAILGEGFFAVRSPEGIYYTRDGCFQVDRDGYLVTPAGWYVLDTNNEPIRSAGNELIVDSQGNMRDEDGSELGQIQIAVFSPEQTAQMAKQGQSLFSLPAGLVPLQNTGRVQQYALERSNVDVMREMIEMVTVARMYEANQKSIQAQDELLGKSINEVGRIR